MSLDFSDQNSTEPATVDEGEQQAAEEAAAPPPPAPASFVLFQAPDPTTVVPARSRRVADESDDDNRDDEATDASESGARGRGAGRDDDEDDQGAGRGRRRRGGRGRRGPDVDHGDDGESGDQAKSRNTGDDEDRGGDGEADDDSGNDSGGAGGGRRSRGGRRNRRSADSDSRSGDDNDTDGNDRSGGSNRSQDTASDDNRDSDGGDHDDDNRGDDNQGENGGDGSGRRRTRRRRRSGSGGSGNEGDQPGTVTKVREPRKGRDEVTAIKGSTRLEAKKQRRREGREAGRKRTVITEAEFLARRESVERQMVVRDKDGRTQIGVLEDGVLVEHYVSQDNQSASMAGNVYLGRVQNVLPSMEAAFVDIGRGRNAVLYAGEVNWDAAGLEGQPKRIENALKSGETVLVQVTKDPIGHKGARLTSQISLPGRYLVYVPGNSMTGISRKLPDTERARLKKILKEVVPADAGVIVRTAAEGASEEELRADVERLTQAWEQIQKKASSSSTSSPSLLRGESELTVRVIRDVFNEDFAKLVVSGDEAWNQISSYIESVAPDLRDRLQKWTGEKDVFTVHRIDEQIAKAMDRKVWLPSGGSLIIDRTEAMTVIDVNTGKFVGSGGNLEETVTKNNLEAAEEVVRQLRLRDLGGIIVVDFIDMVLESNRDLVVRRLLECLGRDRTKHQVAEVTSLGLVQMTRKRVGSGLLEVFSESCDHCQGRGVIVHDKPVTRSGEDNHGGNGGGNGGNGRRKGRGRSTGAKDTAEQESAEQKVDSNGRTAAQIAAAAHAAAQTKPTENETAGEPDTTTEPEVELVQVASDVEDRTEQSSAAAEAPAADATVPENTESRSAEPESTEPTADAQPTVETRTVDAVATVDKAPTTGPTRSADDQPQPTRRPRRRRGRVVAAAGPPPAATGGGDDAAGGESATDKVTAD